MPANNAQFEMDAAAAELRGYVSWQHPFRDAKICFHPNVVRAISSEALFCRRKRPSSEIGGILWGILPAGPGKPIVITNAELVSSEGELYNSTSADLAKLSELQQNRQAPIVGTTVVGYFRSDIREVPCLRLQDRQFVEQEIRDPNAVFLIIEPFEIGICMAAFFFWEDGCLQSDASDLEVPFIPRDQFVSEEPDQQQPFETSLEKPARPVIQKILVESGKKSDAAVEVRANGATRQPEPPTIQYSGSSKKEEMPVEVSPAVSRRWKPSRLLTLILSFLLLLATAFFTFTYFAWPLMRARYVHSQIGLQATRSADEQFSLNWNRSSSVVLKAKGAKLTITDGRLSHELPLDNAQLRSGKILYSTNAPQVQFRLVVYRENGQSIAETVRAASPASPSPTATASARVALNSRPSLLPTNISRSTKALASELRQPPRTRTQDSTEHLKLTALDSVRAAHKPVYNPPRPIRQVMPELHSLGQTIRDGTQISIKVRIDETGHVMSAEPANENPGLDDLLLRASLSAAMEWLFEPATVNNKPAPAAHTIVFNFHSASE